MQLDPERLKHIQRLADSYVADRKLPGYLTLVSQGGEEVFSASGGFMDVENERPVMRDTIFRIYSMTKPIASVALMMLYEEGHFQLDDPVASAIPEWANLKVYDSGDADDDGANIKVREPERPMQIRDLLTHTSGLTYGFMHSHPVDALYRERGIGRSEGGGTLRETIEKLADIPLQFSPGTRWNYSVATDVVGYLVEVFSGQSLDEFVAQRITGPLGMCDSGFSVPADQVERFANCYAHSPKRGTYVLQDTAADSPYLNAPSFLSGGGGMVATIDDYHQFARMLLGAGALGETRLLGSKTLRYMATNHLPGNGDLTSMGQSTFSETPFDGIGFGLGFSVVLDPAKAAVLCSPGEFAWGGAASTYFWVDPVEDIIVIFMTQLLPSSTYPIRRQLKTLTYQALTD